MLSTPNPRYRLYGGLKRYSSFFKDALFNRYTKGDDVVKFENAISKFCGVKHSICVPQNRVGMYLTIKALVKPGQGVIMTPYTIADQINMVICAGARPIFADIERETCNMDPEKIEHLLDSEENIGAVMVTHLHGLMMPSTEIKKLCEKKGVILIEDAAQAFGALDNGKKAGSIGDVGIFSFGMYKNISTWYGGAVITNNDEFATKIKAEYDGFKYQKLNFILKKIKKGAMIDLATAPLIFQALTFWIFRFGFLNDIEAINKHVRTELDTTRKDKIPDDYLARYTPAQARIGIQQLSRIDPDSKTRIKYAKIYHDSLSGIDDLIIPPFKDDMSHIYTYFPVQYLDRDTLIKHIMRGNQDVAAQHYKNCSELLCFKEFYSPCPNASLVADQLIFLPTWAGYGEGNVRKNTRLIRNFFGMQ